MSHDTTLTEIEAAHCAEGAADGEAWWWATEHGAPERASIVQLVSWLAQGELPPHTLVWKPGWGEWLPALQVSELAAAFPRVTRGSRRLSRLADDAETPPPVPVAHYPRLRLLAKDVLAESPQTPATAISQGLAPAQAGRRVLRDLDHVQQDVVTSQVPAAAMLEAALAMKRLGAPVTPSRAEHWGRLDLGNFGEAPPQRASTSARTLSPHALALDVPALAETAASEKPRRRSTRYGAWLSFGGLVGAALGLLSLHSPEVATAFAALRPAPSPAPESPPPVPPSAIDTTPRTASVAAEIPPVAPPVAQKPAGIVERKRKGEPALLQALRTSKNDGFDRVVFEFRERMPGYRLEYLDTPVRHCGSGAVPRIDGDAWLEVRFSPASAHTESGESTVRARELKPALSALREIERTCDSQGIVTWVVGTASARHFRAFELADPPRLVVDIDH
ncbi:MAG TPA: DUF4339 domain-containing protein [Polyangiaceae bacterium]|nr:DUF4339 domain-containing protein [Polyangiaceae bacterium]